MLPMAVSLGFGVLFATFITLILVPTTYLILDDLIRGTRRLLGLGDVTAEGEEQERLSAMTPRPTPADAVAMGPSST